MQYKKQKKKRKWNLTDYCSIKDAMIKIQLFSVNLIDLRHTTKSPAAMNLVKTRQALSASSPSGRTPVRTKWRNPASWKYCSQTQPQSCWMWQTTPCSKRTEQEGNLLPQLRHQYGTKRKAIGNQLQLILCHSPPVSEQHQYEFMIGSGLDDSACE